MPIGLFPVLAAVSIASATIGPLVQATGITACGALSVGSGLPDGSMFSAAQFANASIIFAVGQTMGAGRTGAIDAMTAAFAESRLTNLPFGDKDSLGLFQERPSQGWGTAAQILDPVYASTQFFDHLLAQAEWQSLAPAAAAQTVERSAFPNRYEPWVGVASRLVAGLSGSGACTNGDGVSPVAVVLPAGYQLPAGTPLPVVTAIQFALAQLGKPYVWGGIGPDGYDCSGLTMQAYGAAGIRLPRTTYDQVFSGQPVFAAVDLAPGDLVFTEGVDPGPAGAPGHVGMYIGAGTVIDAPHTGASVELTDVSGWVGSLVAIRRLVPA